MGCFQSKEEAGIGRREIYFRETSYVPTAPVRLLSPTSAQEPAFGEYYCRNCNRRWSSRFSWQHKYQICKTCRRQIYPHSHRKLTASDFDNSLEKSKEHKKELCQMCQQLGYLCTRNKKLPNNNRRARTR